MQGLDFIATRMSTSISKPVLRETYSTVLGAFPN